MKHYTTSITNNNILGVTNVCLVTALVAELEINIPQLTVKEIRDIVL